MSREKVANQLNTVLADAIVFYQKLHHFHWSVKGRQFFELHEKFEALYDEWKGIVDDVAERVLQIGGQPLPTLAAALERASVKETSDIPNAQGMVSQTVKDMETQLAGFHKAIEAAEAAGDRSTANLLDPFCDSVEKTLWMLRAWLAD